MKVLPADLRTAKSLAKSLHKQIKAILALEDTSLQQTHELYAKSLGYSSWYELAGLLKLPHTPLYLTDLEEAPSRQAEEAIWIRLSALLGLEHPNGDVIHLARLAGLGYSPKDAARAKQIITPWGPAEKTEVIAPGILRVSTAAHGGYRLSAHRQKRIEQVLGYPGEWFEEDDESAIVEAAFPEVFDPQEATERLHSTYPELLQSVCGISPEAYMQNAILRAFRDHPDRWFLVDSLGQLTEYEGYRLGFYALTGRNALQWFVDHFDDAAAGGKYFIAVVSATTADVPATLVASYRLGGMVPSAFIEAPPSLADVEVDLSGQPSPRHSIERFKSSKKDLRDLLQVL